MASEPDHDSDPGLGPDAPRPSVAGIEEARIDLRTAAYCVHCDALVERQLNGTCPAGHPAEALTGRILLAADEPVPSLPSFNLAAFLIPPVWGPAHGIWVGAIFLPIWLFADSVIVSAVRYGGRGQWVGAAIVLAATLTFEYFFARRANGVAFRRVMHTMTAEQYARRQRAWAIASVPVAVVLIAWGVYFDGVLGQTLRS